MITHFTYTIWWKQPTLPSSCWILPSNFDLPDQRSQSLSSQVFGWCAQIRSTLPSTSATKTASKKWVGNFEAKRWYPIPIDKIYNFHFSFFLTFFCINRSFTRQAVVDNLPRCLAELFVMCASKISKMVIWKLTWKESIFKIRIKHISVRFARSHFTMRSISIPIQKCMMKEGNSVKYVQSLLSGRFQRVT